MTQESSVNPSWLSPAHRLLYETYARYWRLWQLVCAYRHLSREGIPHEPEEAESICRDILAIEPQHQLALRLLGLSITDQFSGDASDRAREWKKASRS